MCGSDIFGASGPGRTSCCACGTSFLTAAPYAPCRSKPVRCSACRPTWRLRRCGSPRDGALPRTPRRWDATAAACRLQGSRAEVAWTGRLSLASRRWPRPQEQQTPFLPRLGPRYELLDAGGGRCGADFKPSWRFLAERTWKQHARGPQVPTRVELPVYYVHPAYRRRTADCSSAWARLPLARLAGIPVARCPSNSQPAQGSRTCRRLQATGWYGAVCPRNRGKPWNQPLPAARAVLGASRAGRGFVCHPPLDVLSLSVTHLRAAQVEDASGCRST